MSSPLQRLNAALSGRYRVERELGEGGMATVYLAQDVRHDRRVAVKVLKPELAAVIGGDRFLAEIKTTAKLQHPHILPLFDSGEADGFLYYVMPYVEGETLREKLDRERQLGVDESVRIARDVADALDYAHRAGVIHRDIKPANVLLHDGRPVVADFGIALAVSAAGGGRMTETGMSLGTPHYMSPEQASADRDLSARSDMYSLGCVLYEMLAGQPPHTGPSAQSVLVSILTKDPEPVTDFRHTVPANVAGAVAKAIEKLPADRFDSARAFADALVDPAFTYASGAGARPHRPGAMHGHRAPGGSSGRSRYVWPVVAALALVLGTGAGFWLGSAARADGVTAVARLDVSIDSIDAFGDLEVSPDGSLLAITGRRDGVLGIYLRRLDGDPEFRLVPGTEGGGSLGFSPDSRWLVFGVRPGDDGVNVLAKVRVDGGGALTLDRREGEYLGRPVWSRSDEILYQRDDRAFVVDATGAAPPREVGDYMGGGHDILPDGSGRLIARPGEGIFVHDFGTDSVRALVPGGLHPRLVSDDRLLYVDEQGGVFVVAFDVSRREVRGAPVRLVDRVASQLYRRGYAVSDGGLLVYQVGAPGLSATFASPTTLVQGRLSGGVDTIPLPRGARFSPRLSPDGRSLLFYFISVDRDSSAVQVVDLVTGATRSLGGDIGSRGYSDVVWSPDGARVLVGSDSGLVEMPASGGGEPRTVLPHPGFLTPYEWLSPDTIAFGRQNSTDSDLFIASLSDPDAPRAYLQAPWNEWQLRVSPDRRHAVFISSEGGENNVWIRSWPDPSERWQVTESGRHFEPLWAPDGSAVYFWRMVTDGQQFTDSLYVSRIDRSSGFAPGSAEPLGIGTRSAAGWDLHPDGDRYVASYFSEAFEVTSAPRYVVVLNGWQQVEAALKGGR